MHEVRSVRLRAADTSLPQFFIASVPDPDPSVFPPQLNAKQGVESSMWEMGDFPSVALPSQNDWLSPVANVTPHCERSALSKRVPNTRANWQRNGSNPPP
jgi:hypothetical protein